jgi:hypothetical protein
VQTALDLGNELLGATTQHQGTSLGKGTFGEEVETLSTDLALLKRATGTEVALLDVSASRLGRGSGSLANTVHVVGGNTTGTEDIAISEVPVN